LFTKHIHWLLPYPDLNIEKIQSHTMASVRFRSGPSISAWLNLPGTFCSAGDSVPALVSYLFIGKIRFDAGLNRGEDWLSQIHAAKQSGAKIYLDYTDDHIGIGSEAGNFYAKALNFVDACIVPSDAMKTIVSAYIDTDVFVIPDPLEIEPQSVHYKVHNPKRLFWFGHSTNAPFLTQFINSLPQSLDPVQLIALSNESGVSSIRHKIFHPAVEVRVDLWSADKMLLLSKYADVCIIPSSATVRNKLGASANRLITAFALGLPTAAERLSSYLPYSDFFTDIRSPDFFNLLENPLAFLDRTKQSQIAGTEDFSVSRIGARWVELLGT
jgi:hypothetical protein